MYKVLLVEDERMIREGLKTLIEKGTSGFVVMAEAENGKDALHYLRTEMPDLIVTDIRMREVDGLALIGKIREMYEELPIVIISGYGDFHYAQKALKYKVSDYLLKPIDRLELVSTLAKIRQGLDRKKKVQEEENTVDGSHREERQSIRKIKAFIHDHLDGDLRLQMLAECVHLNPIYLSQLFKTETGENVSDYITQVRMNRAKQLLHETSLKVYDIARLVGYQSAKHFMLVFKKEVGMTPGSYRDLVGSKDL
ncbi:MULTISPECIES: response regulator [Brevibacillus]|uniref:response regulator transcription factor n=1 Tax=Brevibacillus TaxID=55080 RepID=UPI000D10333D|nr:MULTISPECIES: response regulator [Brevibacillus]MED1945548.1 response regulator [Brevibacillus formosus]MED2000819.1 response regulator [Brevibacillus formosus]MED2084335.1 response regulator [Brevibacillus formosus]PSK09702.1 DNA-binding response regulator [Brevibacillus sp. NRRL NRS-603]